MTCPTYKETRALATRIGRRSRETQIILWWRVLGIYHIMSESAYKLLQKEQHKEILDHVKYKATIRYLA